MIDEEELPENWTLKPLKKLGKFQNGKYLPKKKIEGGSYPVYGSNGIIGYHDDSWINKEALAIGRVGSCGEINKIEEESWVTDNAIVFWPSEEVLIDYCMFFLESFRFEPLITSTSQPLIRQGDVKDIQIPIPPKPVQEEIVEDIRSRINTINQLSSSTDTLSELTEEYEDSLLAFILSGKKDMSEGAVGGIPTEDVVPDDWRLENFGDVVDVNPRISKPETDTFAHVPMDGVSAETQSIDYFSERDSVYSGLAKFEEGDIVFARITPCMENGKVAIVDELPEGRDMSFGSTELAVFRTKDDVSTEYVFNYVKSQFIREVAEDRMKGATGRERVPLDFFKKELKIPIPPEGQEDEVLEKLRNIRENVNKANHSIKMVDELFDEYRDSVLAHAFKGELLDTEIEDEPEKSNEDQNEDSRPEFDSGGQQSLEQIAGGKE